MFASIMNFDDFDEALTYEIEKTKEWLEQARKNAAYAMEGAGAYELADGDGLNKAITVYRAATILENLRDIQKEYREKYKSRIKPKKE